MNLKTLPTCADDLKIILILQTEMLILMPFDKRVLKQREDIPRYGKTILNNSFLGIACSTIFFAYYFFKNILIHLWTKVVGKDFFLNTSFK